MKYVCRKCEKEISPEEVNYAIISDPSSEELKQRIIHQRCGGTVRECDDTFQTTETGATRENLYPSGDKFPMRLDLMMLNDSGMRRLSETYGEGCAKYGPKNWMNGFPESVMIAHAMDHIRLHCSGDKTEDHLAHAAWNLLTLCWYQEKKPELMDLTGQSVPPVPTENQ